MIGAFIAKKKVVSVFDALNRRDISAFLSAWRDDCVFIYPGDISACGAGEHVADLDSRRCAVVQSEHRIKIL